LQTEFSLLFTFSFPPVWFWIEIIMDLDKMPHEILVVDDSGTDWAGNVILRHWGARVQLNIGSNKI
jgi:hypothetical protein